MAESRLISCSFEVYANSTVLLTFLLEKRYLSRELWQISVSLYLETLQCHFRTENALCFGIH